MPPPQRSRRVRSRHPSPPSAPRHRPARVPKAGGAGRRFGVTYWQLAAIGGFAFILAPPPRFGHSAVRGWGCALQRRPNYALPSRAPRFCGAPPAAPGDWVAHIAATGCWAMASDPDSFGQTHLGPIGGEIARGRAPQSAERVAAQMLAASIIFEPDGARRGQGLFKSFARHQRQELHHQVAEPDRHRTRRHKAVDCLEKPWPGWRGEGADFLDSGKPVDDRSKPASTRWPAHRRLRRHAGAHAGKRRRTGGVAQ